MQRETARGSLRQLEAAQGSARQRKAAQDSAHETTRDVPEDEKGVFLQDVGESDVGDDAAVQLRVAPFRSGIVAAETRRRHRR